MVNWYPAEPWRSASYARDFRESFLHLALPLFPAISLFRRDDGQQHRPGRKVCLPAEDRSFSSRI